MMTTDERAVRLDDGRQTTLQQWGTSGPVVLCVHGIASSRRDWKRFGDRVGSEFRVFAFDQRGHGDSDASDGPMSLERSVADVRDVVATLPGPVDVLIGHSWGGAVALLAGRAMKPPHVVAIDPMIRVLPGGFTDEYVTDLREPLGLAPQEKEAAIRAMFDGANRDDVAGKVHAMMPLRIGTLEALERDNRADAGAWDVRQTVAAYPVPLLILGAGEQSVMSTDDQTFVREHGGPNVTLRTFEGHGHTLHRSAFDAFVDAVRAFAKR